MYHSITYGDKNTWDDWHLIPESRPLFNPPEVKTKYVDIPGGNGQLDLTEALTGYPVYENRTGSHKFYVENDFKPWDVLYSEICNYLHGVRMRAILEDDPDFYYEGRFEVSDWTSDKYWSTITIDYNVIPYKREKYSSLEDWLWDPFNFETGIIREHKDLIVDGTLDVTIARTLEPIVPNIMVTKTDDESEIKVTYGDKTYDLENGNNYIPEILVRDADINLTFEGNATISIDIRGGSL